MPTTTAAPVTTTIDYFESIYQRAQGDPARIPWAHSRPSSALVNWLNAEAPSLVRCGARVAVAGCGLGEDARELLRRGYEVVGFDCAASAVNWARRLDPDHEREYVQADLFSPPARWLHRFDLVVDVNNIQALSPDRHADAIKALAKLMSPHGLLLVVAHAAGEPVGEAVGPPWPLTARELLEAAAEAGLAPMGEVGSVIDDEEHPPVRRIRALFTRA